MAVTRGFVEPAHAATTVSAALAAYARNHGPAPLCPLVVVIAALNEAANLGAVLDEIPDAMAGLRLDVLVVDDGSEDTTAQVAREHGAEVIRLERNCGHGVALRAGYRAAWERGARLVATLDADGQWDPATLPEMVRLAAADRADMVIGSRALGATTDTDSFRTLGVRVFAWLARVLTGACVTDTSSGLRVMRAELLRTVRQTQPQYQTSELLVGAVLAGYRVAEVPTVMRPRLSGESKKGDNLSYALRYCRVLLATWWRESRRRDGVRQSTPPLPVRLVRYALGSVICLAVSEAVLFVLVLAGMAGWRASVLASVAGIVPGYPLNRTWTFGRRGRSSWREVVPYWSSAVAGTVFAAVVVGLATPWARRVTRDSLAAAIIDLAMYVGAYGLIWLVKFAYLDRMLFRSPARTPAPASGPGASVVPLSGQHRARRLDARPENTLLLDLTGDDADLAHSRPHEGAADA